MDWSYDELVLSKPHCEQIIIWYLARWCPDALTTGDLATLARVHNGGGPRGTRLATTIPYAEKIMVAIATQPRRTQG